jgi:capsular polysaccharide biosynthesis protein
MRLEPDVIKGRERLHFYFFPKKSFRNLTLTLAETSVCSAQPEIVDVPDGATTGGSYRGNTVSGVYDANNHVVAASERVRRAGKRVDRKANERDLLSATRDRRDAYYLGRGETHFGHFILETLCRAWAWDVHGDGRVPIVQSPIPKFGQSLLELVPKLLERVEIVAAPTRFRRILVPGPSFVVGTRAHTAFKQLCDRMTDLIVPTLGPISEQPVYLSRAGLTSVDRRALEGEMRLEEFLASQGFLVARPESLPIAEQIKLFNNHAWFMGPMGSAFHMRLFARRATNVVVLTSAYFNENFALCDLLCEGSAHYVSAFYRPDIGARLRLPSFVEPVILDTERLLETLRYFDLIRPTASFDVAAPDLEAYKRKWIRIALREAKRNEAQSSQLMQAVASVTATLDHSE